MRSSRFIFHTAFHPLLLEQTDFLVGQSRHDSPEGLKKWLGPEAKARMSGMLLPRTAPGE